MLSFEKKFQNNKTFENKNERILIKNGGIKSDYFFKLLNNNKKESFGKSTYDFKFLIGEDNLIKKIDLISHTLNLGATTYYDSDKIFTVFDINKTLKYTIKYWEEYTGMKFSDNIKKFKFDEDEVIKGKVSDKSMIRFFDCVSYNGEIEKINETDVFEFYSLFKLLKSRVRVMTELFSNGTKDETKMFHNNIMDFSNHDAIENYGGFSKKNDGDFGKVFYDNFTKINGVYVKISHRAKKVNSIHTKMIVKEEEINEATKDMHGIKVELNQKYLIDVFITIFNSIVDKFKKNKNIKIDILEIKNKNWLKKKDIDKIKKDMSGWKFKIKPSINKKSSDTFKSFSIIMSIKNIIKNICEKIEIQFNPLASQLKYWDRHEFYKLKTKLIVIDKIIGPDIEEEIIDFQIKKFLEENKDFGKNFEEVKREIIGEDKLFVMNKERKCMLCEKMDKK